MCSPNLKPETPQLHSGAACDRLETTKTAKLPIIPEVVWQEPSVTAINQHSLKILLYRSNTIHSRNLNDEYRKSNVAI